MPTIVLHEFESDKAERGSVIPKYCGRHLSIVIVTLVHFHGGAPMNAILIGACAVPVPWLDWTPTKRLTVRLSAQELVVNRLEVLPHNICSLVQRYETCNALMNT